MPLPDVGPLGSLAGWFLAVFISASVLTLVIRGNLVPGQTHERALKREDAQDARLDSFAATLRDLSAGQKFLVDFVDRRENADRGPNA